MAAGTSGVDIANFLTKSEAVAVAELLNTRRGYPPPRFTVREHVYPYEVRDRYTAEWVGLFQGDKALAYAEEHAERLNEAAQ